MEVHLLSLSERVRIRVQERVVIADGPRRAPRALRELWMSREIHEPSLLSAQEVGEVSGHVEDEAAHRLIRLEAIHGLTAWHEL